MGAGDGTHPASGASRVPSPRSSAFPTPGPVAPSRIPDWESPSLVPGDYLLAPPRGEGSPSPAHRDTWPGILQRPPPVLSFQRRVVPQPHFLKNIYLIASGLSCGTWGSLMARGLSCPVACMHAQWLNHIRLFATPWTVARQAPLSMGFSRQEYWSGLPCPPPGDLPDPGVKPTLLVDSLPLSHRETQEHVGS